MLQKSYLMGGNIKRYHHATESVIIYMSKNSITPKRTLMTTIKPFEQTKKLSDYSNFKISNHHNHHHYCHFSTQTNNNNNSNNNNNNNSSDNNKITIEKLAHDLKIDIIHNSTNIELIKSFFNDFILLSEYKHHGNYHQAIIIAERLHQILINATGIYSIPSTTVLQLLLTFYYHTSNVAKIEEVVFGPNMSRSNDGHKSLNQNLSQYSIDFQNKALLLLALCRVSHLILLNSSSSSSSRKEVIQKNFYQAIVSLAMTEVDLAIALCETIDTKVSNNDFSACYGLKGLLCILSKEYTDAETFLQMSARWSSISDTDTNIGMMTHHDDNHKISSNKSSVVQSVADVALSSATIVTLKTISTTQSMISLINLGAFVWLVTLPPHNFHSTVFTPSSSSSSINTSIKTDNKNKVDNNIDNNINDDDDDAVFNPQTFQQNFQSLSLLTATTATTAPNATVTTSSSSSSPSSNRFERHMSVDDEKRIRSAIEYWTDCLNSLSSSLPSSSSSSTTSNTNSDSRTNSPGTTAGCGVSVTDLKQANESNATHSTSQTESAAVTAGPLVSAELLADVDFSIAYSTLLCNLAEAMDVLHHTSSSSDSSTGLESSSSSPTTNTTAAAGATTTNSNKKPTTPTTAKTSTVSSSLYLITALKALEPHQLIHKHKVTPYFSRVLGLIAYQHMRNSQAVSAEGLFRSAIDAYKNHHPVITDPRHAYELAILKGRLGLLYSKWDKRESQAQALVQEAQHSIATMRQTTGISSNINLSQTVQYPLYFL